MFSAIKKTRYLKSLLVSHSFRNVWSSNSQDNDFLKIKQLKKIFRSGPFNCKRVFLFRKFGTECRIKKMGDLFEKETNSAGNLHANLGEHGSESVGSASIRTPAERLERVGFKLCAISLFLDSSSLALLDPALIFFCTCMRSKRRPKRLKRTEPDHNYTINIIK